MSNVSVCNLSGGEKIAKEIVTAGGLVLIPAGTVLKKEYIDKLIGLNITSVWIEDESTVCDSKQEIIEEKIQNECAGIVRNTIEKYSYCANMELQGIVTAAELIMQDILQKKEVMYNISYIREKDENTYAHSINVSAMSVLIGLRIKLSKERIRQLAIGALLHDLGVVYLPLKLKNATLEECNEEQRTAIYKHVITGYSMVEKENWLTNTAKGIILSHHERCDGTGYPMHLVHERIPTEVKIVAVCDEFDSMVYGNFKKKQKINAVVDYIISEAGRKFDFKVVQTFVNSIAVYPIGCKVELNTKQQGRVIAQNNQMPTRPIIQLVEKSELNTKPQIIDLTKELTTSIVDVLDIG